LSTFASQIAVVVCGADLAKLLYEIDPPPLRIRLDSMITRFGEQSAVFLCNFAAVVVLEFATFRAPVLPQNSQWTMI